jgi:hypothetical protein
MINLGLLRSILLCTHTHTQIALPCSPFVQKGKEGEFFVACVAVRDVVQVIDGAVEAPAQPAHPAEPKKKNSKRGGNKENKAGGAASSMCLIGTHRNTSKPTVRFSQAVSFCLAQLLPLRFIVDARFLVFVNAFADPRFFSCNHNPATGPFARNPTGAPTATGRTKDAISGKLVETPAAAYQKLDPGFVFLVYLGSVL